MEMKIENFLKVISDKTSTFTKIHKSKYKTEGDYPIIDQGQEFIAGYTDNKNLITSLDEPVIIFGDHTRILKYIDFPFAIGADGVKVLYVNKEKLNPLYTYYYLKKLDIPSAGYSRHFKFFKKKRISFPKSITDQKRIAQVLSNCESLIQKRKESIGLLDELLKSTFLEMFRDPVSNQKGWTKFSLNKVTSKIGSGSTPRGGKDAYKEIGVSLIRSLNVHDNKFKYKNLAFIDNEQARKLDNVTVQKNDVLFNITGASVCRSTIVPYDVLPARVNQHVSILRTKKEVLNPSYLNHLLISENFKKLLYKTATVSGATREAITKIQLENLTIPIAPIELQNKFAKIVEKVESIKQNYQTHLQELENLYGSISQKAFKGELDLSKVILKDTTENIKIDESYFIDKSIEKTKKEIPLKAIKEAIKISKSESKKKRDITNITYLDFIGMPTDLQMKNYASDYSIETLFVGEKLFAQFYLKDNFKNKEFTLGDVESKFNSYFIPKGLDFNYEVWKGYIFSFIEAKPPLIKRFFDETDNTIKLILTDEAFKA